MRTFIAIELPEELRRRLDEIQRRLKDAEADVSWTQPRNLHLTLRFLGETPEERLPGLAQAIAQAALTLSPFALVPGGLGAFPSLGSPRVIWVGTLEGAARVEAVFNALEDALAPAGVDREDRPFSSHITLGRIRTSRNRSALSAALAALSPACGTLPGFTVTEMALFKSTLTPRGPVYEPLTRVPFASPLPRSFKPSGPGPAKQD